MSTTAVVTETNSARIHQQILNRISLRAQVEGQPLEPLETQLFESDAYSRKDYRRFSNEFVGRYSWPEFVARISGLLSRAIAEDTQSDPSAPQNYEGMVRQLEKRPESFSLWVCCVPAIKGYKPKSSNQTTLIVAIIASIILFVVLKILKLF